MMDWNNTSSPELSTSASRGRRPMHSRRIQFALATLTGILYWLALPMPGIWPFSFVFAAPLLIAIEGQSAKERFLLGWWSGAIGIGGSHYFIAETLTLLAKLPWVAAIPVFLLYTAWVSLEMGVFCLGAGWLRNSKRKLWIVSVPLWFTLVERLHPVVFRSLTSNTLWDIPILVQSLELWGSSGLTACLIFVSCCMAHTWSEYRDGNHPRPWQSMMVAAILWIALIAYGYIRMQAIDETEADETIRVLLVQPNVTVDEKRYSNGNVRLDVYKRTRSLTRAAMESKPDLVVWPEGALPITYDASFLQTPRPEGAKRSIREQLTRDIHQFAETLNTSFVFGSLRLEDGKKRNAALYVNPDRAETQYYDKHQLVLLAERLPFADIFPSLTTYIPGAAHHQPGDALTVFWVKGTPWVPSMCSDALFPRFTSRSLVHAQDPRAVLLNLTNDVWFGDTAEPTTHLMMQSPRAVENRSWLIRSTNSGITAIFDPNGVLRAKTTAFEATTLTFDIPIVAHPLTPYQRFGDWPALGLAMLLFLLRWRESRHHRQEVADTVEN